MVINYARRVRQRVARLGVTSNLASYSAPLHHLPAPPTYLPPIPERASLTGLIRTPHRSVVVADSVAR